MLDTQDYKTYLDFVLALENRKEPQALQYLFRLLDVQNKGFLNVFDLNFFFRVSPPIFASLTTGLPVALYSVYDPIFFSLPYVFLNFIRLIDYTPRKQQQSHGFHGLCGSQIPSIFCDSLDSPLPPPPLTS